MMNEIEYIDIHMGVKFDGISVTFKLHKKTLGEPHYKLMGINFQEGDVKVKEYGHLSNFLIGKFKESDIFKQIKTEYKIDM